MSTERDIHFAGFAELVAQELREQDLLDIGNHIKPLVEPPIDVDYEKVKAIIARRAYDLVYASTEFLRTSTPDLRMISHLPTERWVRAIPDLTAWPTEANE